MSPRHIRRLRHGDRSVPHTVGLVLNLLVTGVISIDQAEAAAPAPVRANGSTPAPPLVAPALEPRVEAAAASSPARTNGHAKPGLSAPVEPTPKTHAKADSAADLNLSTAAKVLALGQNACRFPSGDPGHDGFHFCGAPATRGPYCQRHAARAYLDRRPDRVRAPFRLSPILTARKLATTG